MFPKRNGLVYITWFSLERLPVRWHRTFILAGLFSPHKLIKKVGLHCRVLRFSSSLILPCSYSSTTRCFEEQEYPQLDPQSQRTASAWSFGALKTSVQQCYKHDYISCPLIWNPSRTNRCMICKTLQNRNKQMPSKINGNMLTRMRLKYADTRGSCTTARKFDSRCAFYDFSHAKPFNLSMHEDILRLFS